MSLEASSPAALDADAVRAIRGGDAERYRELVERHECRIFAVAWSRLGDLALAEDATQETFIRAYHRLWMLRDGAKFAGWIAAIAQHVAINLGLRHRRELSQRARWALERDTPPIRPTEMDDEPGPHSHSPEALRQSLERLPPAHRECLVLFYLEGMSGRQAASALGISESAFRVRLHRARSALRQELEPGLRASLGKLRPGAGVAAAIMSAILVPVPAKAAASGVGIGIGAKVASALGQSAFLAWITPFFGMLGALPGMVFMGWIHRMERRNLREPEGVRARLLRDAFLSFSWGFPILLICSLALGNGAMDRFGIRTYSAMVLALLLIPVLLSVRMLAIQRSRFHVGTLVYLLILYAGFGASAAGWLSGTLPLIAGTFLMAALVPHRPARMDYSLFIRAACGMLTSTPAPARPAGGIRASRGDLLAFARFLGERWLVCNYRWKSEALILRLAPVRPNFLANMAATFTTVPKSVSSLSLGSDGGVSAHCSGTDADALEKVRPGAPAPEVLERAVEGAVAMAWEKFRERGFAEAERALGNVPEERIFRVPPDRARSTRWQQAYLAMSALLMLAVWTLHEGCLPGIGRSQPVRVSEEEVRAALAAPAGQTNGLGAVEGSMAYPLFFNVALPPLSWAAPDTRARWREQILAEAGYRPSAPESERAGLFERGRLLQEAFLLGWLTWEDLGLSRDAVAPRFCLSGEAALDSLIEQRQIASDEPSLVVERLGRSGLTRLLMLRELGCLGSVDRGRLTDRLASAQVRSGTPASDLPALPGWRRVRGLFITPNFPTLQDTYRHLAALELLGGLDHIDREACVERILKLHRGAGWFVPPDVPERWRINIRGDAQDTFAAYESLRILGALDRVPDLKNWKFRPAHVSKPSPNEAPRPVTWDEMEALILQQRLERILQSRQEAPAAPWRSLRDN